MNNLSFYIHIPFCVKKCDYCAFYSLPNQSDELKEAYFQGLYKQISNFNTEREVASVYFGGGTPPVLGIRRLCKLISLISSRFTLAQDCEITVEVNPGTVNESDLELLRRAGANRLSVGVQAADDRVLSSIGRIHSFSEAEECIKNARIAGFKNISADIIFALPNQNNSLFEYGVQKIMSTKPDHISAYSLQIEEGTPIYLNRHMLNLPDEDGEEAQYESLCRILKEGGYTHYEISSFCRPGFESRHNLGYWLGREYVGFGAGAHSFYNNRRFSAVANVDEFISLSEKGTFAPTDYAKSPAVSKDEREEERIMLGLRTNRGAVIPENAVNAAKRIAALGYGSFENGRLILNSRGFRVSNEIISQILI